MAERGYQFGPVLTDKVIETVQRVSGMPYRYGITSIPTRFEDNGGDGGEDPIRFGRVTANWSKGTITTVEQLDPITGEPLDPKVEFEAKNWFTNIVVECSGKVACGNAAGTWILISAEC